MITFLVRKLSTLVFYRFTRLNKNRFLYKTMKLFPLILFLVIFVGCNKKTSKTEEFPQSSETIEQLQIKTNPLKNAFFLGNPHAYAIFS